MNISIPSSGSKSEPSEQPASIFPAQFSLMEMKVDIFLRGVGWLFLHPLIVTWYLLLSCPVYASTLKMEVINPSEISADFTWFCGAKSEREKKFFDSTLFSHYHLGFSENSSPTSLHPFTSLSLWTHIYSDWRSCQCCDNVTPNEQIFWSFYVKFIVAHPA